MVGTYINDKTNWKGWVLISPKQEVLKVLDYKYPWMTYLYKNHHIGCDKRFEPSLTTSDEKSMCEEHGL